MLHLRRSETLLSSSGLLARLLSSRLISSESDSAFRISQQYKGSIVNIDANDTGITTSTSPLTPHLKGPSATTYKTATRYLINQQLAATFLPAGYPATVPPNYLSYVYWQALHHGCSSANGVLASTFMLYAVGLSAEGAIATAGALNWVLKDGLGQLGTLAFGRYIAHNFDVSSRLWYILASIKLDIAVGLEICSFIFPQYFLALGSISNGLKGLAWMAGGSSRSSFNVTFATDNNIADITAKATSQTICTSLIGTSAGIALASVVGQDWSTALACFAGLSATHLYSGYKSARCVPLATLNPSRLELLVDSYINTRTSNKLELPSPADVASIDPIMSTPFTSRRRRRLVIGSSLESLLYSGTNNTQKQQLLLQIWSLFKHQRYILTPQKSSSTLHIVFDQQATSQDCIQSILHAGLLLRLQGFDNDTKAVESSLAEAQRLLPQFIEHLKSAGWDADKVVLESKRHRYSRYF